MSAIQRLVLGLALALLAHAVSVAQDQAFDWRAARQAENKVLDGVKLTPKEQALYDKAREMFRQVLKPVATGPGAIAADEAKKLVPLPELTGKYKEQDGGLYGSGSNEPPKAHLELAEKAAARIQPLDGQGKPAADGKIVLVSIGMSNTTMEFSVLKTKADADARKAPNLVIVDGAQGARTGERWARDDAVWLEAERRMEKAKATPAQVQVVWIKQAEGGPSRLGAFPKHAEVMRDNLIQIAAKAKQRWPNVQIAYLSSRVYAGYATSPLNPEPFAYEGAFAVRWAIQAQINGDARLNADPAKGKATAPVLLWGPYLWAAGATPLKPYNLSYDRDDLALDGTHPHLSAREKVAGALLTFFTTDPTAKAWFVKRP